MVDGAAASAGLTMWLSWCRSLSPAPAAGLAVLAGWPTRVKPVTVCFWHSSRPVAGRSSDIRIECSANGWEVPRPASAAFAGVARAQSDSAVPLHRKVYCSRNRRFCNRFVTCFGPAGSAARGPSHAIESRRPAALSRGSAVLARDVALRPETQLHGNRRTCSAGPAEFCKLRSLTRRPAVEVYKGKSIWK